MSKRRLGKLEERIRKGEREEEEGIRKDRREEKEN